MSIPRWICVVVVIAVFVTGGVTGWFAPRLNRSSADQEGISTNGAFSPIIPAIGHIEPADGFIHIKGPLGDRIQGIHVEVGDILEENEKIVTFDSYNMSNHEVEVAKKRLLEARKLKKAIEDGSKREADIAQLKVEQAKKVEANLEKQIDGMNASLGALEQKRILASEILTRMQRNNESPQSVIYKRQEMLVEEAKAAIETMKGNLRQAELEKSQVVKKAEQEIPLIDETKKQRLAGVPLESLEAALQAAEAKRDLSEIRSPAAGLTVLAIDAQVGEQLATPRTIIVLGNTKKLRCVAEVNQIHARDVHARQKAVVKSRVFSSPGAQGEEGELIGEVVRKSQMIDTPGVFNPNPMAPQDRRVVKVTIDIKSPREAAQVGDDDKEYQKRFKAAQDLLGMQVNVEIMRLDALPSQRHAKK